MQGIVDKLSNEYIQNNTLDNWQNIEIDVSEVCRMLLDSKYKSSYSSLFSNVQININKEYVKLDLKSRLIIDKDTILYLSNVEFRFLIGSLGIPSIFIKETDTSCLIAYITFKTIKD